MGKANITNPKISFLIFLGLLLIIIIGIILRIAYLNELKESPDFYVPLHDAEFKDYWARAIVYGNWIPPRGQGNPFIEGYPLPNPPGYPIFLALIYILSDGDPVAVRWVQIGIGILNILLIYLIAKNIFNVPTALFSALGMSVYWAFVYYDLDLNQQTIFIFITLTFIYLIIQGFEKSRIVYFILSGTIFGFGSWFRGENFILIIPISIYIFLYPILNEKNFRNALKWSLVFLIFSILPIIPITIYNYRLCGEFVPVSHTGECSLYIAFDPKTPEFAPYTPKFLEWLNKTPEDTVEIFDLDGMTWGLTKELGKKERVTYREWRNYLISNALRNALSYPFQNLILKPTKRFLYLLSPTEMDENKVLFYEIKISNILKYLPSFKFAITLFTLGVFTLIHQILKKELIVPSKLISNIGFLIFFLVIYSGIFSLIIAGSRYRVPLIPIMLIFGGYGLSNLLTKIKNGKIKEVANWVVLAVILYLIFSIQILPFTPDRSRWLDERRRCYQTANQILKGINFFEKWLTKNPSDADAYYHLGVLYLDAKNFTKAEERFLKCLEYNPSHKSAPYNLAIFYTIKKDLVNAQKYIEIAKERSPHRPDIWFTLGWIYEILGKSKEAEEAYNQAISLSPEYYKALTHLAVIYLKRGDLEKSKKLLTKALKSNPYYVEARFNLAQVLLKERRPKEAIEHLSAIICKYSPQEEVLKSLGIAHLQLLDYSNAEKYLSTAYAKLSQDDLLSLLAIAYAGIGKYREAEECIEKLVYKNNTPQTLFNIGNAYELMKEYNIAKDYYKRVLEKSPNHPDAYAGLGNIALIEGNKTLAYRYFQKALELQPNQMGAWYNLILKQIEGGNLEEGKKQLEEFLKNYPEHIEAYYNLGLICEKMGDIDCALKNYDEALSRNPEHKGSLFSKGIICINNGNLDTAEQLFSTLSKHQPDEAYYHLGLINSLKNNWEIANYYYVESFNINSSLFFSDYIKAFNLGQSFDKLGCLDEAEYFYSIGLSLNPLHPQTIDALAYLKIRKDELYEAKYLLENLFKHANPTPWSFYNYALTLDRLGFSQVAIPYALEAETSLGKQKEILHLTGELFRKVGEYNKAEIYLSEAVRQAPEDFQVLKSLAFLRMQEERLLDADALFQRCLKINQNDNEILEGYADLCMKRGDTINAELFYRKANEIKETPSVLRKLGLLLADRNKLKEAFEILNKALLYEPENPVILIRLGDILVADRKDDEARKFYETALLYSKDNYLLHRNYAELLFRNGEYEIAKKHFQLALELNPDDYLAKAGLGLLYAKENKFEEAKNILVPLAEIKSDLFSVNQQLMDIFIKEGDFKKAEKYLKRCILAQPDRKEFKELLQKISKN